MTRPVFTEAQLTILYDLVNHLNEQLADYDLELVDGDIRPIPVLPAETFLNAPELHPSMKSLERAWRQGRITVIELAREGLRPTRDGKRLAPIAGVEQPPRSRR